MLRPQITCEHICQRVTVSVTAANNNHQIKVTCVLITRTCNLSSALPISTTRFLTLMVRSTVHYPEQYLTLFYLTPPAILQCVSCFPVLPSSTIPEKETLISSLPCHIGLDHQVGLVTVQLFTPVQSVALVDSGSSGNFISQVHFATKPVSRKFHVLFAGYPQLRSLPRGLRVPKPV